MADEVELRFYKFWQRKPKRRGGFQKEAFISVDNGHVPEDYGSFHRTKLNEHASIESARAAVLEEVTTPVIPGGLNWDLKIVAEVKPGLWQCVWYQPGKAAYQRRQAQIRKHAKLKHKAKAEVTIRCGNSRHTIAVVGKSLVLLHHSKNEFIAERAAAALAETDYKPCACEAAKIAWVNLKDLDKQEREKYLPRVILEQAQTLRYQGRQNRGVITCKPVTISPQRLQSDLLNDAVRRYFARLVQIPLERIKLAPLESHQKSYFEWTRVRDKQSPLLRIDIHNWLKQVFMRGITRIDDKLVLKANWLDNDLVVAEVLSSGNDSATKSLLRRTDCCWMIHSLE